MRALAQIVGIVLLTIVIIFTCLGTVIETCTQAAADSLLVVFAAIPLSAVGLWLLIRFPLPKFAWFGMLPALAAIAYQCVWTICFAFIYLIQHRGICDLVTGDGPYDFDGREPIFLIAWSFMSAMCVGGVWWAMQKSFRFKRR